MGVRPLAVVACVLVAVANDLAAAAVLRSAAPAPAPAPPPALAAETPPAFVSPRDPSPLAVPARTETTEPETDAATPPSAPPSTSPPTGKGDVPRTAALVALTSARDSLPMCRRPGGPEGPGSATVRFRGEDPPEISLAAPYDGTSVGACIARRLARSAGLVPPNTLVLEVPFDL